MTTQLRLAKRLALLLTLAATPAASFALPQGGGCPTPDYLEAWVDPFYGNDGAGTVDDERLPYATLNGAIQALRSAGANAVQPGLVHALPGLYADDNAIPQSFPITMRPHIHVQGAGAKECVIRVRDESGFLMPYYPLSTGLQRVQASIAVDFTLQTEIEEPSMFDGFTIQGACVQVYAETEFGPRSGRVSNCVFDMRDGGEEQLAGPYFGVLIAAIYYGEADENGEIVDYHDMPFFLFNNTFLHGVRYGEGDVDVSRPEAVAICNLNDPQPPCGFPVCLEDPNLSIRGVSDLHIQNNLIRALDDQPRTAMLGIDLGDTQVVVSSRTGPYNTNAFNAGDIGGVSIDPAGTFASGIVGLPPVPVVDLTAADPGFVGEYLTANNAAGRRIRDARLLPDSVLRDMGASPAWVMGACSAFYVARNGLVHTDVTRASALSSFDFDGDGLGNARILGADVEVGMDEFELTTLAGSFGNDTKSHHLPYDATLGLDPLGVPRIQTGGPERQYIFEAPSQFAFALHILDFDFVRGTIWGLPLPWPQQVWTRTGHWTHMPGSVAFRTPELLPSVPVGVPGIEFWLDMIGLFTLNGQAQAQNVGSFATTPDTWTNWESGQAHAMHRFEWVVDENQFGPPFPASYLTQQAFVFDFVQGAFVSSNLMADYF